MQQDRWTEEDGPCGLPKVRVYRVVVKKKKKVKGEEAGADATVAKATTKAAAPKKK